MNIIPGRIAAGRFEAEGLSIPVGVLTEGECRLGVRPDAVSVLAPGEGDCDASVFAVEYTGSGALVTVSLAGQHVTALCPASRRPDFDQRIALRFEPSALYLFDGASGARLRGLNDVLRSPRPARAHTTSWLLLRWGTSE
jgi:multiple sugar transport system ATP-binding protein